MLIKLTVGVLLVDMEIKPEKNKTKNKTPHAVPNTACGVLHYVSLRWGDRGKWKSKDTIFYFFKQKYGTVHTWIELILELLENWEGFMLCVQMHGKILFS